MIALLSIFYINKKNNDMKGCGCGCSECDKKEKLKKIGIAVGIVVIVMGAAWLCIKNGWLSFLKK